ncbi:hypothetical protein JCM33374_g5637 [Metschnikowia sp. JCM 33374]|nr:hypothetical protein JCM33374_g5637 [Metschnikowia sp. JCM 33374]
MIDTSILDRVKKRLQGDKSQPQEPQPEKTQPEKHQENFFDTQVIPGFGTSILFAGGADDVLEKSVEKTDSHLAPRAIRLPQLSLDESDFFKPTQVIDSGSQHQGATLKDATLHDSTLDDMVGDLDDGTLDDGTLNEGTLDDAAFENTTLGSTQVIPRQSHNDFLSSTADFSQEHQPETHPKENQHHILAAELTHTSLTDEENDLNDDADTTRDSSIQKTVTTKAELRKIEQNLSEQKRSKNIQPGFEKKSFNPVQQLLDAFDSDSDENPQMNSEQAINSSPSTSPIQDNVFIKKKSSAKKKATLSNDPYHMSSDESDFEVGNVLDLISNVPNKTPQKKRLSPIEEYAEKLKKQLNSSPTSSKNDMIVLDDSDAESDLEITEKSNIPELTKEQAFVIKSKFSRKQFSGTKASNPKFHPQKSHKTGNLFNELRRANAKQLLHLKKSNPESELIEEIEKEEEEMGNLLEREMERVRRIRKREKLLEKAQKALLDEKSDEDYDDAKQYSENDNPSEVPDSEVDSAGFESSDGLESDDGSEQEQVPVHHEKRLNRARRVVLSDDDEQDEESNAALGEERIDDSYMFGGSSKENDIDSNDEPVMQIHSDIARPDSPVSSTFEQGIENLGSDSHKLFANLPPPTATQESSILESMEVAHREPMSFQENVSTQKSYDEPNVSATQVDGPSLNGTSTQVDMILPTQEDVYSDDDDDLHSALDKGRRHIRENFKQTLGKDKLDSKDGEEDEEEEEEVNEEDLKQKLAIYEARIRKKELKARKLRKEMERKGLKGIVEGEAEESDDEWKGIGGMDKEDSDQANSEDERMIDNNFNINLNDEEVRKKFMEQYQIKDRHELEKLMDDIKNHRLTKRSRSNRFDIELSDEEDEILMAYRRQKLEEQKQRLLDSQKIMQSSKSEKAKAFFDSIQEEPAFTLLHDSELSDNGPESETNSTAEDAPDHFSDAETKPKKVKVLEESFVQKQLSFLSKTDEDDYFAIQKASDEQHGLGDGAEDVSALKKKCLTNLYTRPGSSENIAEPRKRPQVEILTDEDDDDFSRVFKRPSMVSSFRALRDKNAAQVSTNSFSGVTVNKHYKVASASKASITYLSKQNKSKPTNTPSFKSSKAKEIEERVERAKLEGGFLSSRDNFS